MEEEGGRRRAELSLSPSHILSPASMLSQAFHPPSHNFLFFGHLHFSFFWSHQSGSREDMYPKRPRTELLTSHISETDALPLPAPSLSPSCSSPPLLSEGCLPPPRPPKASRSPDLGKHWFPALGASKGYWGGKRPTLDVSRPPRRAGSESMPSPLSWRVPRAPLQAETEHHAQHARPPHTHMLTESLGLRCLLSFPSQLTCRPQGSHHHPPAPPED